MAYQQILEDSEVLERIRILVERFRPQWEREQEHAEHHFALDAASTPLTEAYAGFSTYPSDILRKTASQLKARLTENPALVKVEPNRDTAKLREAASAVELVMTEGEKLVTERTGVDPLSGCAEISRLPYVLLHWCKWDELWPEVPEPRFLETLDDDASEADYQQVYGQGTTAEEDDTFPYAVDENGMLQFDATGQAQRRQPVGYRERPEVTQQRYLESKAKAGYPWYIDIIGPTAVAFTPDRSLEAGFAEVLVRRQMALPSYVRELNRKKKARKPGAPELPVLSAWEANDQVNIQAEEDMAAWWEPSGGIPAGTKVATIYQYWTRDECYEVVSIGASGNDVLPGGEVADVFPHPYEMPPFAMCYAVMNEATHDVTLRWESPLEGLYRLKPRFDRAMTQLMILAEMVAMPLYYWARTDDGAPLLREDGTPKYMTRNAADAEVAPAGYKLEALKYELNPAYIQAVQTLQAELNDAKPGTGQAPLEGSDQPWSIRLMAAQANVEPARLLKNIIRAMTIMRRNMALVMSKPVEQGGTGEVPIYAVQKNGKNDQRSMVVLKPEYIETLNISTEINPTTAAERIAKTQHGMELLQASLITTRMFIEDYLGEQNPDKHELALTVERLAQQYVYPTLSASIMASIGYMIGPNGQVIGPGGVPTDPMAMLQQKGYQLSPAVPPGGPGVPGGGAGQVGQNYLPQTSMNGMPALQTPGTIPLPGAPA